MSKNSKLVVDASNLTKGDKEWIQQFEADDQEMAKLVTKSLKLISGSEFLNYIKSELEKYKNRNDVAFYAVREAKDKEQDIFDLNKIRIEDCGSEAIVANIIRTFCESTECLNHPSKEKLIAAKCRDIVLVDDIIGSGQRIIEFLDAFWRSPTIRSWMSYKLIKFHIITYAATENGLKKMRKHKIKLSSDPSIHITCPTFDKLPFSNIYIDNIKEFFKKYGKISGSRKSFWLGYKNSLSALVFSHSCPNNVPAIFWSPHEKWKPIFDGKYISSNISEDYKMLEGKVEQNLIFNLLGQKKLENAESFFIKKDILMALTLIAKGKRKIEMISWATDLSDSNSQELLKKCVKLGFITENYRITKEGRQELNVAKRKGKEKSVYLTLANKDEEYYYPQKLR